MSELGCCFPGQGDKTDMWGALFMADSIRADLRDMGAEVWVLWQPDWNVIAFDPQGGAPRLKKQFFALAPIHAVHSTWLRDHFGRRRLQYACGLFPAVETSGAHELQLGYGHAN
jgi:hypothetical protein